MGLAGLWETWTGPNGEEVDTACIVTTGANAARRPSIATAVVIEPADFALWLDPDEEAWRPAVALLEPPRDDTLAFVPISSAINDADNDGPDLQLPIELPLVQASQQPDPDAQAMLF